MEVVTVNHHNGMGVSILQVELEDGRTGRAVWSLPPGNRAEWRKMYKQAHHDARDGGCNCATGKGAPRGERER